MDHDKQARLGAAELIVCLGHDAIERLDLLIVEARHLQENISYRLRFPEFLRLLHFEEHFLWGRVVPPSRSAAPRAQDWAEVLSKPDAGPDLVPALADLCVPDLPLDASLLAGKSAGTACSTTRPDARERRERDRKSATETCSRARPGTETRCKKVLGRAWKKITDEREKSLRSINDAIREALEKDYWGQDERREVYLFASLQRLKAVLFFYKLLFSWWLVRGLRQLESPGKFSGPSDDVVLTCILRSVMLHEIQHTVNVLGDLRAQLTHSTEIGQHEEYRPIISRRRIQGLFTYLLAQTGLAYRNQADRLLDELGFVSEDAPSMSQDESKSRPGTSPIFAHRWRHRASSSFGRLVAPAEGPSVDQPARSLVELVNSSYWMPDRPDHNVQIAHEVAHLVLARRTGEFPRPSTLSAFGGEFARLLREIDAVIIHSGTARSRPGPTLVRGALTSTEFAADMIAAAVTGVAYLYTLCLELLGREAHRLLELPSGNVAFEHLLWIRNEILPISDPVDGEWYVRLIVACVWIRETTPLTGRSWFFERLVGGVELLAEAVMAYLERHSTNEARLYPDLWRRIARRMCVIIRQSRATSEVRAWRERLISDRDDPEERRSGGSSLARLRTTDRFARPLPTDLSVKLFELLQSLKKARTCDRLAFDDINTFVEKYRICSVRPRTGSPELSLFCFIHDIPWECGLMRARDYLECSLFAGPGGAAATPPLATFSSDFAPGRRTYQVAVDFYIWLGRRPYERLASAAALVKRTLDASDRGEQPPSKFQMDEGPASFGEDAKQGWAAPLRTWLEADEEKEDIKYRLFVRTIKRVQNVAENLRSTNNKEQSTSLLNKCSERVAKKAPARVLLRQGSTFQHIYEDAGYPGSVAFFVDMVHGKKLAKLAEILKELLEKTDGIPRMSLQALSNLQIYILANSGEQRSETRDRLWASFTGWRKDGETEPDATFRELFWITLRNVSQQTGKRIAKLCRGRSKLAWDDRTLDRAQPILGSADFFSEVELEPLGAAYVLRVREPGVGYIPYFVRREAGYRFRFRTAVPDETSSQPSGLREAAVPWMGENPSNDSHAGSGDCAQPVAILSIRLRQRSERLDFLYRLLKKSRSDQDSGAYVSISFSEHDYGYMTEGAEDIIIVFCRPREGRIDLARLRDVWEVTHTIADDFMVERTELTFLATALEVFLSGNRTSLSAGNKPEDAAGDVRPDITEDLPAVRRRIRLGRTEHFGPGLLSVTRSSDYEVFLHKSLHNVLGTKRYVLPGRADYLITFTPQAMDELVGRNHPVTTGRKLLAKLHEVTCDWKFVDSVETTLVFPLDRYGAMTSKSSRP